MPILVRVLVAVGVGTVSYFAGGLTAQGIYWFYLRRNERTR